jgi:hypothetical protein
MPSSRVAGDVLPAEEPRAADRVRGDERLRDPLLLRLRDADAVALGHVEELLEGERAVVVGAVAIAVVDVQAGLLCERLLEVALLGAGVGLALVLRVIERDAFAVRAVDVDVRHVVAVAPLGEVTVLLEVVDLRAPVRVPLFVLANRRRDTRA